MVASVAMGCGQGAEGPDTAPEGGLSGQGGAPVAAGSAQAAAFDDLSGSFATPSGLEASFSGGALVATSAGAGDGASLSSRRDFADSSDAVVLTFTSPSGATGQLSLSGQIPGAVPGALTFSCADPGPGQSLYLSLGVLTGSTNLTYIASAGGTEPPEGSCTLAITAASLVDPAGTSTTEGVWGLHGTLTATLVNYENTTQTATFSASF